MEENKRSVVLLGCAEDVGVIILVLSCRSVICRSAVGGVRVGGCWGCRFFWCVVVFRIFFILKGFFVFK